VALGGGTGLPVVLRGLKGPIYEAGGTLTGIVTVTDDGGSSGRLRRDFDALPVGDIRNCLVALSENEPLMSELFQYRYRGDGALGGHSMGNLILTALADCRGSYLEAIEISGEVLAIRGRILPATLDKVMLRARLQSGRWVRGESKISQSALPIAQIATDPPSPAPAPGVLQALREADLVVLGPGSLYTSVLPNLLVRGVAGALRRSRALKVLVGNLMTQPGETDGYAAIDHLKAVEATAGPRLVDCYLANSRPVRPALMRRYADQRARPVPSDAAALRRHGVRLLQRDLLREDRALPTARHHERKLARALLAILRSHHRPA
jgi:uncharacterized cofD-like protein